MSKIWLTENSSKHRSDKGPESRKHNELLQYNNDNINPNNTLKNK